MADIEFLDPGPWQLPAPVPDQHLSRPGVTRFQRVRVYGPMTLWAVAGVLAVIAPFQLVYGIYLHTPGFGQNTHADGWGRLRDSNLPFAEHETRYGIIECVAGGLLLIAAGLAALAHAHRRSAQLGEHTRPSSARLAAAGVGIAGTALLAGTVATALLYLDATRDNIEVQLDIAGDQSGSQISTFQQASVQVSIGWMIWLTIIAVGCALLALLLQALPQPAPVQSDGPDGPDGADPADRADPAAAGAAFWPAAAVARAPIVPAPFVPAPFDPAPFDPRDELLDSGPPRPPSEHPPIG